jgi:hypothetical protein
VLAADPCLNIGPELLRLGTDFLGFGVAYDVRYVVIEPVSLPPASFEIKGERRDSTAHRQLHCFETGLVGADSNDAITGAGDRHFGDLQCRVVGGGETSIGGKGWQRGIIEVAIDNRSQRVKLLFARDVSAYAVRRL